MMRSSQQIQMQADDERCRIRNRQSLVRVALMTGVSAALASMAPAGLALASFGSLLLVGSLVAAGFALVTAERPMSMHLTRWDEAAALLGLSILVSAAVDPMAAEQALLGLAPLEPSMPALP